MTTCEHILRRGMHRGSRCRYPPIDGTVYCEDCAFKRFNHPVRLTRPEISPALQELFINAEKLKVKRVGDQYYLYYLHVKYPHNFKSLSMDRTPDRARVHFVKTLERIDELSDLLPGDLIVVKGKKDPIIHKENELDRSSYPLLYWKPLMFYRDPIPLTPEIRAKLSEVKSENDYQFVTFIHGGVEHKIVNDGFPAEEFFERLKKGEDLQLKPHIIDEEMIEGRNALFATLID